MTTEFDQSVTAPSTTVRERFSHWRSRLMGKPLDYVLDGIETGELSVTWPDGRTTVHGKHHEDPECNARITLHNYRPLTQLLRAGEVGFAESYLCGDWTSDNLEHLFLLVMRNEEAIAHGLAGGSLMRMANTAKHWLNRNSLRGSERNIAFHYDLGNDFYELWLDDSMSYSSAVFDSEQQSLADAQLSKLNRVAHHLSAKPGDKVLEIGCGWGALGRHLAEQCAVNVEGISLSREQLAWANEHNRTHTESGASGSTEFKFIDYREVEGTYDHVVSIEMFEAVGEQYWSTYFRKLSDLLVEGGTAVLQVITILEERFEIYRSNPDFIQRYIFPGGMLPTKTHLSELADRTGFEVVDTEWFGMSYAKTLADWRERFNAVSSDVSAQGFDERFMRMWRYYLSYCEAGFRFGSTDVGMLVLKKR
jgi:cyclopropane-fatty-acyl-phospholipid synthase